MSNIESWYVLIDPLHSTTNHITLKASHVVTIASYFSSLIGEIEQLLLLHQPLECEEVTQIQ